MPEAGSVASGAASGAAAGAAFGPWGAVIGGVIGGGAALLGGKNKAPGVAAGGLPPYQAVNLTSEQRRALDANRDSEDSIEALLARANAFNQGQATGLMEQAVPGWGKLSQKFLQTADQMVSNPYDVPKDVEANLARIAAERGISSGARGQFSQFSLLRDLGVNALNYGQSRISQGQSLLQLVGSLSPRVSPLSPLSFYITPGQAADVAHRNSSGIAGIATGNQNLSQDALNASVAAANQNNRNQWQAASDIALLLPTLIPKDNSTSRYSTAVGPGGDPGPAQFTVPGWNG